MYKRTKCAAVSCLITSLPVVNMWPMLSIKGLHMVITLESGLKKKKEDNERIFKWVENLDLYLCIWYHQLGESILFWRPINQVQGGRTHTHPWRKKWNFRNAEAHPSSFYSRAAAAAAPLFHSFNSFTAILWHDAVCWIDINQRLFLTSWSG